MTMATTLTELADSGIIELSNYTATYEMYLIDMKRHVRTAKLRKPRVIERMEKINKTLLPFCSFKGGNRELQLQRV